MGYNDRMGIVATMGTADAERIVAHAHWILQVNSNEAEVAFSVADAYQNHGIGTYMSHLLVRLLKENGVKTIRASTLQQNGAMRRVFEREAAANNSALRTTYENGVLEVWFDLAEPPAGPEQASDRS